MTTPIATPGGHGPDSPGYEALRTRYFNARLPNHKPAIIHTPRTTSEVSDIVRGAKNFRLKVGVRSGGHLFSAASLINDGVLIDCKDLNRDIGYDPESHIVSFSPGSNAQELSAFLTERSRFFPFGHDPTVGIGGFLLAGGQGWFMREWGLTGPGWLTQIEVVLASGEIVLANEEQHADLFWAARGSGQGFFGVVTRFWARTIPSRKLYHKVTVYDVSKGYKPFLTRALQVCDQLPRDGLDIALTSFHPGEDPSRDFDEVHDPRVFLACNAMVYAPGDEEARTRVSLLEELAREFKDYVVDESPVVPASWENLWPALRAMVPTGHGERWQVDSILSNPDIPDDQLVDMIKPIMCDLPTQKTVGTICVCHYDPDLNASAVSIPQKHYISTMACWRNPELDRKICQWMQQVYAGVGPVSIGMYIADFDVSKRKEKVMTDETLKKWLRIRRKYDIDEVFIGYRGFGGSSDSSSNVINPLL